MTNGTCVSKVQFIFACWTILSTDIVTYSFVEDWTIGWVRSTLRTGCKSRAITQNASILAWFTKTTGAFIIPIMTVKNACVRNIVVVVARSTSIFNNTICSLINTSHTLTWTNFTGKRRSLRYKLAIRAGKGTLVNSINFVINWRTVWACVAFGKGIPVASCTSNMTSCTLIVRVILKFPIRAILNTSVSIQVNKNSWSHVAGCTVFRLNVTGLARCMAEQTFMGSRILIFSIRAHTHTRLCSVLKIVNNTVVSGTSSACCIAAVIALRTNWLTLHTSVQAFISIVAIWACLITNCVK